MSLFWSRSAHRITSYNVCYTKLLRQFSVWSGALATAGNLVFYGTLEGYLKAVDAETG